MALFLWLGAHARSPRGGRLRHLRTQALLISVIGATVLSVVLVLIADAVSPPDSNVSHSTGHLAIAIPAFLLAWSIARWCPRRKNTRSARWGRRAATIGLVMISAGFVLEAIGAFGYDGGNSRIAALTMLHNASWVIQFPGVPILLVGILLGCRSLFQRAPEPASTTS